MLREFYCKHPLVLYLMQVTNCLYNTGYKKSIRTVNANNNEFKACFSRARLIQWFVYSCSRVSYLSCKLFIVLLFQCLWIRLIKKKTKRMFSICVLKNMLNGCILFKHVLHSFLFYCTVSCLTIVNRSTL